MNADLFCIFSMLLTTKQMQMGVRVLIAIAVFGIIYYLLSMNGKTEMFRIHDSYPPKGNDFQAPDFTENPAPVEIPNREQDTITTSVVTNSSSSNPMVQQDVMGYDPTENSIEYFNNFGNQRDYTGRFREIDRLYKMKDTDYNRMKKLEKTNPSPNYPIPRVSGILLRDQEREKDIVKGNSDCEENAKAERLGAMVVSLPSNPIVANNLVE